MTKSSALNSLPVALVTGGAKRIGAAIVRALHQENYNVIIHYNNSEQEAMFLAQELEQQRPNSSLIINTNFQSPKFNLPAAKKFITKVYQWQNRLDLLVNNASLFKLTSLNLANIDLIKDWQNLFTVNVQAPFLLSISSMPYLAITHGNIINITDIHADKPLKNYSLYCQTKAALNLQTKALAREFAPNIRVNALAPGAIIWPEKENSLSPTIKEKILAQIPLKRHGEPQHIAQAVLSIAKNSYINGQILAVDGGRNIIN